MPIPFICPHCGTETLVDDLHAGKTGPCVICGRNITVPYAAVAPAPAAITAEQPVRSKPKRGASVAVIIVVVLGGVLAAGGVLAIIVALFFPAFTAARSTAQRQRCHDHLEQIAAALRGYHLQHGAFPPAYLADENGQPMHSWRVLILPFLNEHGLYAEYDMNQPWDSTQNMALLGRMPAVYACPGDTNAELMFATSYVLVTGPNTVFPHGAPVTEGQITDMPSLTLLVVEQHDTNISWLEPRDLDISTMQFQINGGRQEIRSRHADGANVATADGTCHFLRDTTSSEFVKGLITKGGGETLPPDLFDD